MVVDDYFLFHNYLGECWMWIRIRSRYRTVTLSAILCQPSTRCFGASKAQRRPQKKEASTMRSLTLSGNETCIPRRRSQARREACRGRCERCLALSTGCARVNVRSCKPGNSENVLCHSWDCVLKEDGRSFGHASFKILYVRLQRRVTPGRAMRSAKRQMMRRHQPAQSLRRFQDRAK